MSAPDRRALIDRDHAALSIRHQCTLLGLARSGVYRPPRAANDNDLAVMRRIDELFTAPGPVMQVATAPCGLCARKKVACLGMPAEGR